MKERIRLIMEQAQMSQQDFAMRLGISPASLSSIFTGRTNPTNNHVQAIHRAFPEVNVNWLLFGEGEMKQGEAAGGETKESEGNLPEAGNESFRPDMTGMTVLPQMFDDEAFAPMPIPETRGQVSPTPRRDATSSRSRGGYDLETAKKVDKPIRRIKEIRVFFDDGTYEAFVPSGK